MNRTLAALALAAATLGATPAMAQTADQILKMWDDADNSYKDLTNDSKMVIHEPGNTAGREFSFVAISRSDGKRLVRFTSPGDVKGMGFLVESSDVQYAYLPGFQRVRRLGTHVRGQGLMGSDVSSDEMSAMKYSDTWQGKMVGEDGNEWVIEMTPRPGKTTDFPKMKVWVDKKLKQPTKMESYDSSGKKAKTQLRINYKRDEGSAEHWSPERIKVTDHRRNDHWTEIVLTSAKNNTGVPEDTFTQRALLRNQ